MFAPIVLFGKLIVFQIIIIARQAKTLNLRFKMKFKLVLKEKEQFAKDIYGFWFAGKEKINFTAGQFLEWTIDHKTPDNKGIKRFFTIASSPTEKNILLVTKITKKPSSFKSFLKELDLGSEVMAEGPYGSFVFDDYDRKNAFIAGGVGVTPFRSILKFLLDTKEKKDIIFFYGVNLPEEIAFFDFFDKVRKELGVKIIYVAKEKGSRVKDWQGELGYMNKEIIERYVEKVNDFNFYVSGPEPMVHKTSDMLFNEMKVDRKKIKHDYFPGYNEI